MAYTHNLNMNVATQPINIYAIVYIFKTPMDAYVNIYTILFVKYYSTYVHSYLILLIHTQLYISHNKRFILP